MAINVSSWSIRNPIPIILMFTLLTIGGVLSFMSFTLYRAAHQTHHMHLATERDEELWPFVNVKASLWSRRLAAAIELNLGLLFTPFLFWRIFFRKDSLIRSRKVRRRIWLGWRGSAALSRGR